MSHTPGPWRMGGDGNMRVYGPDGAHEHSGLIASVFKGRDNARLIAAAPEMFKALQYILAEVDPYASIGPSSDAIDQARAAIAKAEGR